MNNKNEFKSNKDYIKKFVNKQSEEELSPMDPPDAYDPQNIESIPYEQLDPFIQKLVDEHKVFSNILLSFEEALINWRSDKWIFNKDIDEKFKNFFTYIDENVPEHNMKEENLLFPLLHKRLVETGEHNAKDSSITGINIMEDEHIKVAQAAAIVFNFLGLGSRLPDEQSRGITFKAAFDQGIAIVETMKLHIFREDNILFTQAMNLLTQDEFSKIRMDI